MSTPCLQYDEEFKTFSRAMEHNDEIVDELVGELGSHYGWTDEELEDDLWKITEYIDSVCITEN
ncbi:hypothetical protein [Natrinema soli]|uniref:Uncharacterized protein n=1 Tax=Natrinema soli TaxID=1930624 RepID=A0ABD5SLT3_9EURY|nr:hypothetical protein [Natrinema soli]